MCTKKILYQPSDIPFSPIQARKENIRFDFAEIGLITDSIRLLASKQNRSIAETLDDLKKKNLFPQLYKYVKENPRLSHIKVANRIYKQMEKL